MTIDIFNKNPWLHKLVADARGAAGELDPNTSLWRTFGGGSDGGSDGHSDGGTDDRSD